MAIGFNGQQLSPCPDSPNCVSSQANNPAQKMEPWPYTGSADAAKQTLVAILQKLPRCHIVQADKNYLHATFTSRIFRFVDDVEFLIVNNPKLIEFRSASRSGYSDLGVNRRRMKKIEALFRKQTSQ